MSKPKIIDIQKEYPEREQIVTLSHSISHNRVRGIKNITELFFKKDTMD